MAIKQTLSLFFLSLFFPSFIFAQNSLVLDWEQCRKIAFENNSSLKSKKLSIEEYRYKYLAGLNDYYPKISLSHSLRRSGGDSGVFNTVSAGISASEKIFDLRTLSSIKIRKFSYEKMIFFRFGFGNFQKVPDFEGNDEFTFQPNLGIGVHIDRLSVDYAYTDIGDQSIALYSHIFSLKYSIDKK